MLSPSPNYPQNFIGDFRGYNPKKPQNWTHPRPKKFPRFFSNFVPVPAPSPENRGRGGENRGLGLSFPPLLCTPLTSRLNLPFTL